MIVSVFLSFCLSVEPHVNNLQWKKCCCLSSGGNANKELLFDPTDPVRRAGQKTESQKNQLVRFVGPSKVAVARQLAVAKAVAKAAAYR